MHMIMIDMAEFTLKIDLWGICLTPRLFVEIIDASIALATSHEYIIFYRIVDLLSYINCVDGLLVRTVQKLPMNDWEYDATSLGFSCPLDRVNSY